ncbi:stalk domain-containing protein [Paenibacillus uliginis]
MQTPINVTINGELLTSSFPSIMSNSQITIPLKDTAKALRAELVITPSSSDTAKTLYTIKHNQTSASFRINQLQGEVNGKKVTLSSPPYITPGAIMIPVSLLKQMGLEVTWNSKLSELSISSK